MPRESKKARQERAHSLLDGVLTAHPDARCALDFETPFQLLVATILSAQNTDENINTVTPRLFSRFPDAAAMAGAELETLEEIIHSTGFFRQKAKSVLGMARAVVEHHAGEIPDTLEELVELPGVGRKTANLILGTCFGVPGLVVDTHVSRLAQRWALTAHTDAVKIERDLMELIPMARWTAFSHATIFHGRRVCAARRPQCEDCALRADCPHAGTEVAAAAGRPAGRAGAPRKARKRTTRAPLWMATLALVGACSGSGSDIGPRILPLSSADYRVLVLDDAGRPATSVKVTVDGLAPAFTSRRGRAAVLGTPSGVRLITVDGTLGSASAGDALGRVVFALDTSSGREVPYAVHLPDLSGSAGLAVPAGAQPAAVELDDSMSSGAVLSLGVGTVVTAGSASSAVLRTGLISAHHLPGTLPPAAAGARLWGAGVLVAPLDVSFGSGASLSLPNDLGLVFGATADLYRLDGVGGEWVRVGTGTVDPSGNRIDGVAAAVRGGGVYAFTAQVSVTASLSGRVLGTSGESIRDALVRAGDAVTRTRGDGRFTLPEIAAVDASGAPQTVALELRGGRDWLPVERSLSVTLSPGSLPQGDIVLETSPVVLARLQLINRGHVDPWRRLRISSAEGLTVGIGVGDEEGRMDYPDVVSNGFIGVLTSQILDAEHVLLAEGARFVGGGDHHVDMQVFAREVTWWTGRSSVGTTGVRVVDRDGTGPIRYAAVTRGTTPGEGFVALTRENGVVNGEFGRAGQATAVVASSAAGVTMTSATTLVDIDTARIEIPLERARHQTGVFDPYGLARGQLIGGPGAGGERRVRATRFIELDDWYEAVLLDHESMGDAPRLEDPSVTGMSSFLVGVPLPVGHLAAVTGPNPAAGFTPTRFGIATWLRLDAGAETIRDVTVDLIADNDFLVGDALTNLHTSMTVADLSYDLAFELADGTLVDVARGIDGGLTTMGTNLSLRLPQLQGVLAGGRHLVALGGAATAGGKTVDQRTMTSLDGGPTPFVRFLDVPDIIEPAPGQAVSGTGFTVRFTVPISTLYTVVTLRSETSTDVRSWTAVLPASFDRFTFRELPSESAQPLAAGRTWTLKVTAARIETGLLTTVINPYHRSLQNWVGIGVGEREINAVSSTSISVTTN